MSSFDGIIRELNVAIDFFRPTTFKCSSFFLSHVHSDHTTGLIERPFINHLDRPEVFLFCSEITSYFLTSKYAQFGGLKHKIVTLQPNIPSQVQVRDAEDGSCQEVSVSAVPAGHCPGSVMFLFEWKDKTVLYTGDFRLMKGDVRRLKPLHSGSGVVKAIDTLYLDTTFFSSFYWRFPARRESIDAACNVARNWICNGPQYHINFSLPAWTGTEYLFARVAKCFRTKIHVSRELYSILGFIPEVEDAVTDNYNGTQIHAVKYQDLNELRKCLATASIKTIHLSAMCHKNTKAEKEFEWCRGAENTYKTSICYSSHCSYVELEDVITHLKPHKIFPCVKPVDTPTEDVKLLMQELGVPHLDLSVISDDCDEGHMSVPADIAEEQTRGSRVDTVLSESVTKKKMGQPVVMEKLVDSPPPKRKRDLALS